MSGPDGNLWFTEYNADQIGRITPTGVVTEFKLTTPNSQPDGITVGPDGSLSLLLGGRRQILLPEPGSQHRHMMAGG